LGTSSDMEGDVKGARENERERNVRKWEEEDPSPLITIDLHSENSLIAHIGIDGLSYSGVGRQLNMYDDQINPIRYCIPLMIIGA
jgi:hypothetical protein